MQPDAIDSNVTKLVIFILAWLSGHYLPPDLSASLAAYAPTIAAGAGAVAAVAYGWYKNHNTKKVPITSTALDLPTPPPPVGTVINLTPMTGLAKVVGALFIGFMVMHAMPATAAPRKTIDILKGLPIDPFATKTTAKIAVAPAAAPASTTPTDTLSDLMSQIEAVQAQTITDVVSDIDAADLDAGAIVTAGIAAVPATATSPAIAATPPVFKDGVSHACYPAAVQFLESLPVATPPTGKLVGVQLFQKKRDFIALIQAGLPVYLKLGCVPLLGDEINTFIQLMAMVGVKILPLAATALMPALAPLTLPALTLTP